MKQSRSAEVQRTPAECSPLSRSTSSPHFPGKRAFIYLLVDADGVQAVVHDADPAVLTRQHEQRHQRLQRVTRLEIRKKKLQNVAPQRQVSGPARGRE